MDLRFQRKGLLSFDASILSGKPREQIPSRSRTKSTGPTRAENSVFREVALLDLSNNSISSLANMQLLVGLRTLDLSNNRLTSLLSQGAQRQLVLPRGCTRLDLSHNALTSVAPLAEMSSLEWLNIGYQSPQNAGGGKAGSSVAHFDTSTMAFLPTTLRALEARGLALTSIESIAHLEGLERLDVSDNQLASVEALLPMAGAALVHLTLAKNPVCPHAFSLPEVLSIALLGSEDIDPLMPQLQTINGRRVPARRRPSLRQRSEETAIERIHVKEVPSSNGASRNESRSSSARSQSNKPQSSALADTQRRADESAKWRAPRRESIGSPSDLSFTPEFGSAALAENFSRVARGSMKSVPPPSQPKKARTRRVSSETSTSFAIDVDSIRLQEMHKLLQELTLREQQLKKTYRTQQLSIEANAKVASDQKIKLEALIELEVELSEELQALEDELSEIDSEKRRHNSRLIESRISYAV